ncbi:MAG: DMT family transporter [Bacteroidota bacterium]
MVWLLVGGLTLIFGSSFILLKWALEVYSPGQVFAGRMTVAALFLLPAAIREIPRVPKDKWLALIAFACVANIATTWLNALALKGIDSSIGSILNALTPMMTLLIGGLLYQQKLKASQGIGLLVGLAGTILILMNESNWQIGQFNLFTIYALIATISGGYFTNIIKFNLQGLTVLQFASIGFLLVLPVSLGYGWYSGLFPRIVEAEGGVQAFGYVVILAIFTNAIGLLLLGKLIQLSSPVFASLINYLVPVVALFWGYLDNESIGWLDVLAMLVISAGVFLVNQQRKKDRLKQEAPSEPPLERISKR